MGTYQNAANVSYFFQHNASTRRSCITFGVLPAVADAASVANAALAAFTDTGSLKSKMSSNVTLARIKVSLGTDTGEDLVSELNTAAVGTSVSPTLPGNDAVLVHKRSARGGRRGRGRIFIPWFVPETNVGENGIIDSSYVVTLGTCVSAWFTALGTRNIPMQILHQPGETPEGVPTPVTSLSVDPLISTQRRRLGR
jgi:hypothetical protein